MFRFTIRDVLWLMVVVGLLLLWASERKWRSIDWAKAMKNEGRLYDLVEEYREKMYQANARAVAAERTLWHKAHEGLTDQKASPGKN